MLMMQEGWHYSKNLFKKNVAGWNVTSGNVRWFGSEGDAGRLGWAAGGGGVTPVSCETETR